MFTHQKKTKFALAFIFVFIFAGFANAQNKKETLKDFLSDSEFGLQRKLIKDVAVGQKGLLSGSVEQKDIKDILVVDLIDPFENKTIAETKTGIDELDDGIDFTQEDEIAESINSFRGRIEDFFDKIETQTDVDVIDLLNHLKINRIISSPEKFVVIQGKKYQEKDIIKVRVNRFSDDSDFKAMLNSVKVKTENSEESEILKEMKEEATERYNRLTENSETALNIVKINVEEIVKHQVSFIIDGKVYKLVMKN